MSAYECMLTGRRLCVSADLETVFIFQPSDGLPTRTHSQQHKTGVLSHVLNGSAPKASGARWGTQLFKAPEPKKGHFWAIF